MREEWRAEQESATLDAAEQWRHSRPLLDLARDHMHRGDRVAIAVAGHRYAGEIIEVARDRIAVLDVVAGAARVDVHVTDVVPLAFTVVGRARAGGRSNAGTHTVTFRARLLQLEAAGAPVVVATALWPDRFTGLLGVGADHVVITTADGTETVISLSAVASVAPVA
jgi:hypothetical protein